MKKIITTILIVAATIAIYMYSTKRISHEKAEITNIELIPVYEGDTVRNAEMHALIERYRGTKDEQMNVVIGKTARTLEAYVPESPLTNLVADMILNEARKTADVDMAITNVGGIRRNLYEGNVTIGDIYEISPFDNSLLILEYKGEDILCLADAIAKKGGESISGMTLKINKEGKAVDVKINNKPIDTDKIYKVVTSDYLSWGNDQLKPLTKYIKSTPLNIMLRDAMINAVKDMTAKGEIIDCDTDKRIIIL